MTWHEEKVAEAAAVDKVTERLTQVRPGWVRCQDGHANGGEYCEWPLFPIVETGEQIDGHPLAIYLRPGRPSTKLDAYIRMPIMPGDRGAGARICVRDVVPHAERVNGMGTISFTATKQAEQIARDIERRLLEPGRRWLKLAAEQIEQQLARMAEHAAAREAFGDLVKWQQEGPTSSEGWSKAGDVRVVLYRDTAQLERVTINARHAGDVLRAIAAAKE